MPGDALACPEPAGQESRDAEPRFAGFQPGAVSRPGAEEAKMRRAMR